MEVCGSAKLAVVAKILLEPFLLRTSVGQSPLRCCFTVECNEVPVSEVITVEPLEGRPGTRAKISIVRCAVLRLIIMIADCGTKNFPDALILRAPGRSKAPDEITIESGRISVVTSGEHSRLHSCSAVCL